MTPLLHAEGLCKRFGGLRAVDGVRISLPRRGIRAIIGPNGAGKTTLVGLLCGRLAPDAGRIVFDDRDVTALRAWERARLGIVYTFQVTSIFRNLSCYENVALAAQRRCARGLLGQCLVPERRIAAGVADALEQVGLADAAAKRADALPYGHQRLLEVAMSLALEPDLLILDEPTQGLAEGEIEALCERVRAIAARVTVLLIEHNMPVVLALAGQVTVMDQGRIIAEGDAREIEHDAQVQRAYLGT